MSDPPDEPRPNYRHLALLGTVGASVIAGAIALHLTTAVDIIWSELGLNIGTGIGLFAMLFFVERQYIHRQVRTQTAPALAQVASVAQQAQESLRDIDLRLAEALAREDSADRARAIQFEEEGDSTSLSPLLQRAQRLGAISRHGVRTPIPGTPCFLRAYRLAGVDGEASEPKHHVASAAIRCVVERLDRTPVGEVTWMPETPAEEAFLRLYEVLANDGHAPSVFDTQAIRSGLVGTLVVAIESRTNREEGLHPVGKILQQLTEDWVVTVDGLENLRGPQRYTIEQLRSGRVFNEGDDDSASPDGKSVVTIARDTWRPHNGRDPYTS